MKNKRVSFKAKMDKKDIDSAEELQRVTRSLIQKAKDRGIDISNTFERVVCYDGDDCINNKVTMVISYFIKIF